jgi:hypothetical protein
VFTEVESASAAAACWRASAGISLFKNFIFNADRGTNLQFRAEFFNIWNHPQWIGDTFNGGISTNYVRVTSAPLHPPMTLGPSSWR